MMLTCCLEKASCYIKIDSDVGCHVTTFWDKKMTLVPENFNIPCNLLALYLDQPSITKWRYGVILTWDAFSFKFFVNLVLKITEIPCKPDFRSPDTFYFIHSYSTSKIRTILEYKLDSTEDTCTNR